jgi:polygalacturonase
MPRAAFMGRMVHLLTLLFLSPTSACFELAGREPWFSPEPYTLTLDGRAAGGGDTNVFSLFGLRPGREHRLLLRFASGGSEELSFRTPEERCALDVRAFGAAGDGETDDTAAIQAAISFLPEGGRLFFPSGTYRSLPLALKSHIHLELAEGAVLQASPAWERYPVLPGLIPDLDGGPDVHFGAFEGQAKPMLASLLTAQYAEDITITGPGAVDGSGEAFWRELHRLPAARPRLLFFNRCRNVRIHGIRARNSPAWHLHPYYCADLGFYDLSVSAPKDSPNTDAIDPESCDGVDIIGCRFSVGDDCIAVKSGKIELGRTLNRPADHHTIRNCLMDFGHGAVTLGSEIGAGVRHLWCHDCIFEGTDRGLRIKTRRGRGKDSIIEDIVFENILMDGVLTPFVLNSYYWCCDPDGHSEYVRCKDPLPVDERTPEVRSLRFKNITAHNCHAAAAFLYGLPESKVGEIEFSNVSIDFAKHPTAEYPAMMADVEPCTRKGVMIRNCRKLILDHVQVEGAEEPVYDLDGIDEIIRIPDEE